MRIILYHQIFNNSTCQLIHYFYLYNTQIYDILLEENGDTQDHPDWILSGGVEGLIVWQNSNPENPTGTCCMWKWKCSGGIMCPLYPQTEYSGNVINLFQSCIRPKRISFNIGSLHGHMLNELNHRLSTPETVAWGPARPPGHWGPNDDSRPWI